jgi:indole-3-glycerol phosphate synthase
LAPSRDVCGLLAAWSAGWPAVFAEIKRRSPSAGALRPEADAGATALAYARAGAFGISVLTEPDFFGGRLEDLEAVRLAVDLPVLYKDFVLGPYQLWEARSRGADLVLLMVSLLGASTGAYVRLAREIGIEPLVEVRDERELETAVEAGARLVGVNNRDLRTLRVDLGVSRRLLPKIPDQLLTVVESGLKDPAQLEELSALGARAFLIGGSLMAAEDPGAALSRLLGRGGP